MISVIIPANNEEGYIGTCLELLLRSGARPVVVTGLTVLGRVAELDRPIFDLETVELWH